MEDSEKQRLIQAIRLLSESPEVGYNFMDMPHGMAGAAEWSSYLLDLSFRLNKSGSPEQLKRIEKLNTAYKLVVQDLNQSYMLFWLYWNTRKKLLAQINENEILNREIALLRLEVEKLQKTINFE